MWHLLFWCLDSNFTTTLSALVFIMLTLCASKVFNMSKLMLPTWLCHQTEQDLEVWQKAWYVAVPSWYLLYLCHLSWYYLKTALLSEGVPLLVNSYQIQFVPPHLQEIQNDNLLSLIIKVAKKCAPVQSSLPIFLNASLLILHILQVYQLLVQRQKPLLLPITQYVNSLT